MVDIILTLVNEDRISLNIDSVLDINPVGNGAVIITKDGKKYFVMESKSRISNMIQAAK